MKRNTLNCDCHVEVRMDSKIQGFINQLTGKKLESLCCEAEILDFGFSGNLVLHAMGCCRIIADNDILVTTLDYQSWDGKSSTNNDEWYNMDRFRDRIIGGTVVSATINQINDLYVLLDNGITIECLIANAYPHYEQETEQWLLFEHTSDHSGRFLIAYNKRLEFP